MSAPLYTRLESDVLVALQRIERVAPAAGWVSVATLSTRLPTTPTTNELDTVLWRLIRRKQIEKLLDRYPPTAMWQAVRRLDPQ